LEWPLRKFKLVVALDVVELATGDEVNCPATTTSKKNESRKAEQTFA